MARYWVTGPHDFSIPNDPNPLTYRPQFTVRYFGVDVPSGTSEPRTIEIEPIFDQIPAQIASMLVDRVVSDAASIGLVVARTGGLIPNFSRGA